MFGKWPDYALEKYKAASREAGEVVEEAPNTDIDTSMDDEGNIKMIMHEVNYHHNQY